MYDNVSNTDRQTSKDVRVNIGQGGSIDPFASSPDVFRAGLLGRE